MGWLLLLWELICHWLPSSLFAESAEETLQSNQKALTCLEKYVNSSDQTVYIVLFLVLQYRQQHFDSVEYYCSMDQNVFKFKPVVLWQVMRLTNVSFGVILSLERLQKSKKPSFWGISYKRLKYRYIVLISPAMELCYHFHWQRICHCPLRTKPWQH